jgi:hypothetical protein
MQRRLEEIDESIVYHLLRLDSAALSIDLLQKADSFMRCRLPETTYATLSTTLCTAKRR